MTAVLTPTRILPPRPVEISLPDLAALRARELPVATVAGLGIVFEPTPEASPAEFAAEQALLLPALDGYLAAFALPLRRGGALVCLRCDADLTGLFGMFQWGVVHGEASCGACGWPLRAVHAIPYGEGPSAQTITMSCVLAVHPNAVAPATDEDSS